jgi:hypothetical protein
MEKTDTMPIWVYLAFASIETRRTALILIYASALFALYCVPWTLLYPSTAWLGSLFLIDDWSWLAMMVPMTFWYWLSMRWVDKHAGWSEAG